jgi:hypothetical protein
MAAPASENNSFTPTGLFAQGGQGMDKEIGWDQEYLCPNDRGPLPEVREDCTELAWAEFAAWDRALAAMLRRRRMAARAAAPPPPRIEGLDLVRETSARSSGSEVRSGLLVPASKPEVHVEATRQLARANGRVCPLPREWRWLLRSIPAWPLPAPGAALSCWHCSDWERARALREQIDCAAQRRALPLVHRFLAALPEHRWHHLPAGSWPQLS